MDWFIRLHHRKDLQVSLWKLYNNFCWFYMVCVIVASIPILSEMRKVNSSDKKTFGLTVRLKNFWLDYPIEDCLENNNQNVQTSLPKKIVDTSRLL